MLLLLLSSATTSTSRNRLLRQLLSSSRCCRQQAFRRHGHYRHYKRIPSTLSCPSLLLCQSSSFTASSSFSSSSSSSPTTTSTIEATEAREEEEAVASRTTIDERPKSLLNYYVQDDERGNIGIIELNNPKTRHALSLEMLQQLQHAINYMEHRGKIGEKYDDDGSERGGGGQQEQNDDTPVRVVIIQATPTRTTRKTTASSSSAPEEENTNTNTTNVFCSGHDLKQIQQYQKLMGQQQEKSRRLLHKLYKTCSNVMLTITNSNIIYIAKINGIATAAGCQLVATCDLAYATRETSSFITPGNYNIGLFCTTPSVALLHNNNGISNKKAVTEMLLLGQPITATKAMNIGLINDIVENELELNQRVNDVANLIATQTSYDTTFRFGKSTIRHITCNSSPNLEDAYKYATKIMVKNSQTQDCIDGINSFLSKTKPNWKK